jgi:uncharacterized membrane protein YgdD (TMEM256/DUF423 family)
MRKTFFRFGILFALLAVILGAFGAHALKEHLSPEQLASYETGIRYQFYHALALLFLSVLMYKRKTSLSSYSGWFFIAGTILFSGSIYLLALRNIMGFSASWLGPITPFGGVLLIIGWALLFFSSYQTNDFKKR